MNILCENCSSNYTINNFNTNLHYFYCKKCIKNINIISKTKCQKLFILDDNDLINIKYIYPWGSNHFKYYKMIDVQKITINKYGSIENLNKIILERKSIYDKKLNTIENNKIKREQEIQEIFKLNKLEFKNYGEAYSYIHYGKPEIDVIIDHELEKLNKKNKRRMKLSKELAKLNISFDETIKECYNYVHDIGTKSLNDTVRIIEINHFLKQNTNYEELCKEYDSETAKDIAIREYSEKNLLPEKIIEYNKINVCFE